MAWRRRQRYGLESVWYLAASCIFVFLFGNFLMLQSYYGFVEQHSAVPRGQEVAFRAVRSQTASSKSRSLFDIQRLSRELLVNRNVLQKEGEYFGIESRLRKLMEDSLNDSESVSKTVLWRDMSLSGVAMLGCAEIDSITNREYVASGWTKAVFKGIYQNRPVALKTVDIGGQDVTSCMENGGTLQYCYHRAANKIIKEIVLLQALAHDSVIQVLGYCVPDKPYDGDGDTTVVMATELGEPIDLIKLLQMSWEDRLRISYDLTRLLDFLSRSRDGAVAMNDFRRQQFVLVHGALKLSDVDDAGFQEPTCVADTHCILHFSSANFTKRLRCIDGHCQSYNEYRNMFNAGRHFTTFLLPHGAPRILKPFIDQVVNAYENCSQSSKQLRDSMDNIVQMYKDGNHLNRTQPEQFHSTYKEVDNSDLPGQFDYRCRMSMSGAACTLSMFDQREAEDTCNEDPECKGFIMTHQKTWTDRTIVHFKNGIGPPSVNLDTKLMIKPS